MQMFGFGFTQMFQELQGKLAEQIRVNVSLRLENSRLAAEVENTKFRLGQMVQERDDIQLRMHAIDHAYNEQQTKENTLLRDTLKHNDKLMQTIRRQREFIRTLYTSRKARKAKGATRIQSEQENSPKAKSGGNAVVSEGNLRRSDVIRQEEGLRSGQIGCNGQAAISGVCNHRYVYYPFGTLACINCQEPYRADISLLKQRNKANETK